MTTASFLNEEMNLIKSNDGFIIKVYINYESGMRCSIKSWQHDTIHDFVHTWVANFWQQVNWGGSQSVGGWLE